MSHVHVSHARRRSCPATVWLLLLVLLTPMLRAQTITTRFSGVTTFNPFAAPLLDAAIPVGSSWSATVKWDAGLTPTSTTATQAGYRVSSMSLTLHGVSEDWTTDVIQSDYAPSFTVNQGGIDEIQFTSGWGPEVHTNPTIYELQPYSINIVLGDPTGTAVTSLTPAPTSFDLSDWSASTSRTYLKIYLNNLGSSFLLGSIGAINGVGSGGDTGGADNGGGSDNGEAPAGPVTVETGTLVVTNGSLLGTGATVSASATLDLQNITVTAPVTLNGGTLAVTTGTSSLSGNVSLGADSTVAVSGTQLTVSGSVSGSFGINKTGDGALVLSGSAAYTGTTAIQGGTLRLGASGALSGTNSAVTISAGATLDVNGVTDAVGSVSGSGNILVSAGSLTVGANDASTTFAGAIGGTGSLNKTGSGTLTLSGANTFTGSTTVSAGTLVLFNSSLGSVQIVSGSTLGGIGTLRGDLGNNGLLSPGFSPGTVTIAGDFTQGPAGRLRMELASAADFDRLVIGGTAALGGTLDVVALPGFAYQAGQEYAIITAGSVTGTFATVNSPFGALPLGVRFATLYSPTAVKLSFQQLPFSPYALTDAQVSVAAALDAALAGGRTPALQSMFNTYTDAAQVRAGLDQLVPLDLTHWFEAALGQADATSRAVRVSPGGVAAPGGARAWADVFRRDAHFATQANEPASRLTGDGVLAGVDWTGASEWSVGVLLAYEQGTATGIGRTSTRSFQPAVTARREAGAWRTDAVLGHGWHDYESDRPVTLPAFPTATASGDTSGRHWFASLRQSYAMEVDAWTFTPALELQHFSWSAGGFAETGAGEASLQIGRQSGRSLAGTAGARLEYSGAVEQMRIVPFIEAAWRHEFRRGARLFDAELAGSTFTVTSLPPSSSGWSVAAGVSAAVTDRLSLGLRYQRERETSVDSADDWQARLSYGF